MNSLFLTPVLPNQIFSSCIAWAHARRACSSIWIRMGSPPESPAGKLFVPPPQPACLVPTARRWSKGSHLEAHRGPAALYKVTQSSVSVRLYSLNSICSFSPTACAPSLKSGWALFHGCCAENFYASLSTDELFQTFSGVHFCSVSDCGVATTFFPTVIRWRQVAAVCAKRCKVFRNPSVWIRCSRTHLSRESYRCDEDRLKQRRNCRVAYSLFAPYGREFTEGDFS